MSVIKVVEIIASSENGFDDAVQNAVEEASKSVDGIESVYVKDMNANVEDGQVISYAVNVKVSFKVGG